jgi:formylglycine-generating enzyme required for sulfatase activity
MSINVVCASCNKTHQLLPSLAGKKVRCSCGAVIIVSEMPPALDGLVSSPPVDPLQLTGPVQAAADDLTDPLNSVSVGGQSTWSDQYQPPFARQPEKKGLPGWLLPTGIGGACLLVLVAIVWIVFLRGSGDEDQVANTDSSETAAENPVAGDADGNSTPAGGRGSAANSPGGSSSPSEQGGSAAAAGSSNPNEVVNSIGMRLAWVGGIDKGAKKLGTVLPEIQNVNDKNNAPPSTITADESPMYTVSFEKFLIGVHEVTQSQYREIMGENPSTVPGQDIPVHDVSWYQAQEFCQRLNELPAEKDATRVYRLPTEAEWEYASRGGTKGRYYFGESSDELAVHAWYRDNSQNTVHPVGQKEVSPSGTYDMLGNVWEWCQDWYGVGSYAVVGKGASSSQDNGLVRVIRGGSSWNHAEYTRDAFRFFNEPGQTNQRTGFRVMCSLKGKPASVPQPVPLSPGYQDLQKFAGALVRYGVPNESVADRRDLTQLPVEMFSGEIDRPEIIKSASLSYDRMPSNLRHTTTTLGSGNTVISAYAVEKETTGGMRHADGLAISLERENGQRTMFFVGPVSKFVNGWKISGRFDYVNQMPYDESMLMLDELKTEIVVLPGEDKQYGLGYQRGAPVSSLPFVGVEGAALAFQISLSPDYRHLVCVYAHEEVVQGIKQFTGKAEIAIWKLEDRSVVFQKEWSSADIGGRVAYAEFTPDSKKLYYGKSRLFVVELDTYQEATEMAEAPSQDNEWLVDPGTGEPVFLPDQYVSVQQARFQQDGNLYVMSPANSVSVFGSDGRKKSVQTMPLHYRNTFGVTRNGDILAYFNPESRTEDPRAGWVANVTGGIVLSAGWQATGPRQDDVKNIATHENTIPTTISPDATTILFNERVGSRDVLKIWQIARKRSLFMVQYHMNTLETRLLKPPYFSNDGRFLMLVIDKAVVIWKLEDAFAGESVASNEESAASSR